jgi:uncharacterized phage protein gp47/JayE
MTVSDLAFIDSTGYNCADYPTFLQFVQDQYRNIYGTDVYLGADSMDGQWTAILAQALYDTAQLGQAAYNSFSPVSAQGVGLSRVVKINGLRREIPTNSTAILTIVGVAGTVITNGIAVDTLNQQWALPTTVTIPGGGSIAVTATAVVEGAIQAGANTITGIFTPTLGWQTVNNAAAATAGAAVEADGALRLRQAVSTALPAQTVIDATVAALSNLTGVTEVKSYENATETTDGNGLTAHSVCFIVQGGTLSDIINTIGLYKTPGTTTFASGANAQSGTYYDSKGMPVPINFINPAITAEIKVGITISAKSTWNNSFETTINAALQAFIQAVPIGGTVVLTELYGVIYGASPIANSFTISALTLAKNAGMAGTSDIVLLFDEIPINNGGSDITWTVT